MPVNLMKPPKGRLIFHRSRNRGVLSPEPWPASVARRAVSGRCGVSGEWPRAAFEEGAPWKSSGAVKVRHRRFVGPALFQSDINFPGHTGTGCNSSKLK